MLSRQFLQKVRCGKRFVTLESFGVIKVVFQVGIRVPLVTLNRGGGEFFLHLGQEDPLKEVSNGHVSSGLNLLGSSKRVFPALNLGDFRVSE